MTASFSSKRLASFLRDVLSAEDTVSHVVTHVSQAVTTVSEADGVNSTSHVVVTHCKHASIYILASTATLSVSHCRDCVIYAPAVVLNTVCRKCRHITLHCCSRRASVAQLRACELRLSLSRPLFVGRNTVHVVVAPFDPHAYAGWSSIVHPLQLHVDQYVWNVWIGEMEGEREKERESEPHTVMFACVKKCLGMQMYVKHFRKVSCRLWCRFRGERARERLRQCKGWNNGHVHMTHAWKWVDAHFQRRFSKHTSA